MASLKRLTGSKNMMNEIFSFIDGNTIIRKMILLSKRMRDEVLTQLGPMQVNRIIIMPKRRIYSLKYCKKPCVFKQEVASLFAKVYRYTNTIKLVEP